MENDEGGGVMHRAGVSSSFALFFFLRLIFSRWFNHHSRDLTDIL